MRDALFAAASPLATTTLIALTFALLYTIVCMVAYKRQRSILYGHRWPFLPPHPKGADAVFWQVDTISIVTRDHKKLYAWHWPAPKNSNPWPELRFLIKESDRRDVINLARTLRTKLFDWLRNVDILLFHGNAANRITRKRWMLLVREVLGCSVTVLDYRGYGGSQGTPTQHGLLKDGRAAIEWLRSKQSRERQSAAAAGLAAGASQRQLVLWGESLGSAVAVALAARPPEGVGGPDAVVIESGFSSIVDVAAHHAWYLPVRLLMMDKFESDKLAPRLKDTPVLIMHGRKDQLAPIKLARKLYNALPRQTDASVARSNKEFVEFPEGEHNGLYEKNPGIGSDSVVSFLSRWLCPEQLRSKVEAALSRTRQLGDDQGLV